jgi:hypothetical protein
VADHVTERGTLTAQLTLRHRSYPTLLEKLLSNRTTKCNRVSKNSVAAGTFLELF